MRTSLLVGFAVSLLVIGAVWSQAAQNQDPEIISKTGVHWHATVEIYAAGKKLAVPESLGVGRSYIGAPGYDARIAMSAVHTHDASGTVHLEFAAGPVRAADLNVEGFGALLNRSHTSLGSPAQVIVNGRQESNPARYIMRDGDQIALHFE